MQKIKFKSFVLIIPILIFSGISFYFFSLIFSTLKFDVSKNKKSRETKYSYVISSSDNKILSKLSRKFEIDNSHHKIPFFLKHSFVSSEDKRFYKHNGIDLKSISRALIQNIRSGYVREGGSTITQQVARLLFLNNDLSFQRKIKEIFISLILEFRYNKNQILKLYLNNIYLGSGAYGINEAAQVYFGKFIEELTLSEIALITGLAPAPSIYSPYQNLELAIKNRNKVLESMYVDGYISLANKNKAIKEKIKLNYQTADNFLDDKLLINFILQETDKRIGSNNDYKFLRIKSSINKDWQEKGQQISRYAGPKKLEFALLSIESNTGLIRTMITSKHPSINEYNRVISSVRPLGSTFKIIPYTAALIEGIKLSDKFEDLPRCWESYCPKNFSEDYRGSISLIESFKSSSNIVPISITKKIGLKNIINLANSFGLGYKQEFEEFPSLAIGSYGDNLLNITNAYSAINNNGKIQSPEIIEKIESFNDKSIWENKSISKKILDLKINKKINKLLEKSVKEGTSKAASIKGKKIYGKTGTSDGNKDLWFIGSIDNLTTGIWIGYDDNKESELSSGNAAYLWKKFISEIYKIPIKK
ncbi:penicillin-binding protein [Prochlorococcus marinus str. XMU1401]|uniref:Penicillin-binding protein n=1 Tax=Prochlorococcus marinus str. XMU1401 TaxID=2052594 RepID=A0A8I2BK77_PROMR|nr:transglycosylase domain-containing protein [Prochlorococcus marinus]MBO8222318.1 penicillin-binding protein [Prochlorococcus marinus str. XMU1401]MBW3060692.1 penicillin-binding protein [Prochlorococcus marinus str. XMU1401E]MCQ9198038.1 transglycosylase domain-containing protein [Prochlorococcus marinus XMU1429]PJC84810.1 penicillin-binding protein [Prochlorococcus marinus str. XMU1401]